MFYIASHNFQIRDSCNEFPMAYIVCRVKFQHTCASFFRNNICNIALGELNVENYRNVFVPNSFNHGCHTGGACLYFAGTAIESRQIGKTISFRQIAEREPIAKNQHVAVGIGNHVCKCPVKCFQFYDKSRRIRLKVIGVVRVKLG